MQKIGKLIDNIPLQMLVIMSIFLGMAPYIPMVSEVQPHLVGKVTLLLKGELVKPIDIFDLFLHGTPLMLLIIRLVRKFGLKTST